MSVACEPATKMFDEAVAKAREKFITVAKNRDAKLSPGLESRVASYTARRKDLPPKLREEYLKAINAARSPALMLADVLSGPHEVTVLSEFPRFHAASLIAFSMSKEITPDLDAEVLRERIDSAYDAAGKTPGFMAGMSDEELSDSVAHIFRLFDFLGLNHGRKN